MSSQIKTDAYSTEFQRLSDLKNHVGKELGLTDWVTITQERIDTFANATDDHQWIHINPDMSKKYSPYKTTVAHGFLVLSLASKFCYEAYKIEDAAMGVNYGLDKVRFPNATPVGALIRGRVSLLTFDEIENGARFKVSITFELKGQEKPACVAEFIGLVYVDPTKKSKPAEKSVPEVKSASKKDNNAILYKKEGAIATITLNRPDRYNAVNTALNSQLQEALRRARKDDSIRAVIITGAGQGFCAGADMENFNSGLDPQEGREIIINTYQPLMRNFLTLRKPIIGAIHGSAAGVGAAVALACDLRVMADNASLLYAFINIGLGPDGGAGWLLARQVGYSRAFQIAIEGKKITADRCLELGLANKVVSADKLLEEAKNWAQTLAERPTLAVGITKEDLYHAMNHDLYENIAFEADQQTAAFASHDLREGVMAFLQKRKAKFIGK